MVMMMELITLQAFLHIHVSLVKRRAGVNCSRPPRAIRKVNIKPKEPEL